jgi:hypothetical protein
MPKKSVKSIREAGNFYKCALAIRKAPPKAITRLSLVNQTLAQKCTANWASQNADKITVLVYLSSQHDFTILKKHFQGAFWNDPAKEALDTFQYCA